MATFLDLARRVASDSGTVDSGVLPATVTGQTGRLAKIVRWTNDAWRDIQNAHTAWRWMQGEFTGSTVAAQVRYDAVTDFSLPRFAEWIYTNYGGEDRLSIYDPAVGVSSEGMLSFWEWDRFYAVKTRGTVQTGKPTVFSIDPANMLCLSPTPDKAYTVRGLYQKTPQDLTADTDVPEMPARFHTMIAEAALMRLGTHDEAVTQLPLWQLRKLTEFSQLESSQLPRLRLAGALA